MHATTNPKKGESYHHVLMVRRRDHVQRKEGGNLCKPWLGPVDRYINFKEVMVKHEIYN